MTNRDAQKSAERRFQRYRRQERAMEMFRMQSFRIRMRWLDRPLRELLASVRLSSPRSK